MVHYTPEERICLFWSMVDIKDDNECWLWKGAKTDGYGNCSFKGKATKLSHRIAFELFYDRKIAPEAILCHSCDVRACCNPRHLTEGTHKSNSDEKFERGRFKPMKGEINGRAKLRNEFANVIRHR